jgi:thioredoxin-like negative regulator of GroEL
LNVDKGKTASRKFRVQVLPTIVFADGKGKAVGKIRGYRPAEEFMAEMEKIARLHRELPVLQARFEADSTDLETGGMLAAVYAFRGDRTKAKKAIKAVEEADPENEHGHLTEAYMAMGEYYDGKEEYKNAGKFYEKAALTGKDPLVVGEARYNTAQALFHDQKRFDPGNRIAVKRLAEAQEHLNLMLAMALPEDQKQSAKELLESVEAATEEHEKRQEEKKAEKRNRRRRR